MDIACTARQAATPPRAAALRSTICAAVRSAADAAEPRKASEAAQSAKDIEIVFTAGSPLQHSSSSIHHQVIGMEAADQHVHPVTGLYVVPLVGEPHPVLFPG